MLRDLSAQCDESALTTSIVFGERHLRTLLHNYQNYYNECRTHLSSDKDAPISRAVQLDGRITANRVLGGLHHQYCRI